MVGVGIHSRWRMRGGCRSIWGTRGDFKSLWGCVSLDVFVSGVQVLFCMMDYNYECPSTGTWKVASCSVGMPGTLCEMVLPNA